MTPPISETLVEQVARAIHRATAGENPEADRLYDECRLARLAQARAALESTRNDERKLVEAAQRALNYIENTEGELGITLECGDALRTALADFQPTNGEA